MVHDDKASPRLYLGFPLVSVIAIVVLAAVLALLGGLAAFSPTPVWRLVALSCFAFVPFSLAIYTVWKKRLCLLSPWPTVAMALTLRLICVASPPVFSDDVYRFVWDGRVLLDGTNPYRHAPLDPELASLRDANWGKINNPELRTIYPPLSQLTFTAAALIAARPWTVKLQCALLDTVVVLLVFLLAGGRLRREQAVDESVQSRAVFAGLAYGLCPLPCIETAMSGHTEPFAMVFALGAILAIDRTRGALAAILLALGAGMKLVPLIAIPVVASRFKPAWLIVPLIVAALYLPFISAGARLAEAPDAYLRRWEGNTALFALVYGGAERVIAAASGADSADAMVHIKVLDPLARALDGTFFALHKDGAMDPAAPGAFPVRDLALAASKTLLGLAFAAIVFLVTIHRTPPTRATSYVFGALVLVMPVLHPWYLLWVLPLAAVLRQWPWFVLAMTLPLSYLALEGWWSHQVWEMPPWLLVVEYAPFVLATALFFLGPRPLRRSD